MCHEAPFAFRSAANAERIARAVIRPRLGGTWRLLSYITVALRSLTCINR